MIKRSESRSQRSAGRHLPGSGGKRRLLIEGLEQRQLLNAGPVTSPGTSGPVNPFDGARNIGNVPAFQFNESENTGQLGENDSRFTADAVPLGTGPGQQDTVDITGTLPFDPPGGFPPVDPPFTFRSDLDVFEFQLRAGDILDLAAVGAVGSIDITYGEGTSMDGLAWFGAEPNDPVPDDPITGGPLSNTFFQPPDSPLQNIGTINASQVVPETGTYYLTVSPGLVTTNYTIGARVYRPVAESLPIGSQQIVFLDFDGAIVPRSSLGVDAPVPGVFRIPSLFESLVDLGFEPLGVDNVEQLRAIEDELINKVLEEVELQFGSIASNGSNGDYNSTGIPGQFGLRVMNSRDDGDPAAIDPALNGITTRVLVGGINDDIEQGGLLGVSTTIDVGNFSMDDTVFAVLDLVEAFSTQFPLSNSVSVLDVMARSIATTITHEAGHSFGLWHTNGDNFVPSIIDEGPGANTAAFFLGVGNDGIFGTSDDMPIEFPFMDEFSNNEQIYFGYERVADAMAHSIVSGTVGSTTSGRVFEDVNRNGSATGDPGLPGATIFADLNGNGTFDSGEPSATSASDGTYTLSAPADSDIVALPPSSSFVATTPEVVATAGGDSGINFGFTRVRQDVTGTVTNELGFGVEGAFVYVDLDGDKRPDLGEPSGETAADGTYSLMLPGPGTYTICIQPPAGFEQIEPAPGTGRVLTFTGSALSDNANFVLRASTDFGDAPASYGSASHGLTSGLTIGAEIDREAANQPSVDASGDDSVGIDDEDGVQLTSPLGPGGTASFDVTVTNTTAGTAFLQGFIDFDRDGSFTDPGEQFLVDGSVAAGTVGGVISVPVTVPSSAAVGDTFVRFRLSRTGGVGPTGFVASGEVEDHPVSILTTADLAIDDNVNVTRNSSGVRLEVLANDFDTPQNPLRIDSLDLDGTEGMVTVSSDGRAVIYTPQFGAIGVDRFSYTAVDQFGNRAEADVTVNILFQSDTPTAVDDTFRVSPGSSNNVLRVLDNDVPSVAGGLIIVGVTPGSAGGFLERIGGGQSIRYTPAVGFVGTEQFRYTVQDTDGQMSTAEVTVHLEGSDGDDVVAFSVEFLDAMGENLITSIPVDQEFQVRVSVDDINNVGTPPGVATAYVDLLYSDALVAVESTGDFSTNPLELFEIDFGSLFGQNQQGDAQTPGLIDDVGAIQQVNQQMTHTDAAELFTITMKAIAPGTAIFQTDPADAQERETAVIGGDVALTPSQLRFSDAELTILPVGDFAVAIDDAYSSGIDDNGQPIASDSPQRARLDVLRNDILSDADGPFTIQQIGINPQPVFGNAFVDDNNTPDNRNDDFISYQPNSGQNGLETFSYFIVSDGVRSTANVTIALGNQNEVADVAMDLQLVSGDGLGTPITTAGVGDRIGVQIDVDDLRQNDTFVFAAYLDLLYPSDVLAPAPIDQGPSFCAANDGALAGELGFLVCAGDIYAADAFSGSAAQPGIINELGSVFGGPITGDGMPIGAEDPATLATVYFDVIAPFTDASFGNARIVASPADALPQRHTLVFEQDEPVQPAEIRYGELNLQAEASSTLQNVLFPQDVDGDGEATARDALIVINHIDTDVAEGQAGSAASHGFFTDVNGDSHVTALDALQIINYLARGHRSGEAEAPIAVVGSTPAIEPSTEQADAALTALTAEEPDKIVAIDDGGGQAPAVAPIIHSVGSHSEDDKDDTLDLLADDVLGQWNS